MIDFSIEKVADILDEVKPLLESHYKEVEVYQGNVKLNPNYELLTTLEETGVLTAFIMRDEGKLVGYSVFTLTPTLHYKDSQYATNFTVFICPEYRHTEETVHFFYFCEEVLKSQGASLIHYQMKVHKTYNTLMESLGYEHTENIFTKFVGQ